MDVKDVYIKILFTRFDPFYMAFGNEGQIAYVYKAYQSQYDKIAMYRLSLNNACIEGEIRKVSDGEHQRYKTNVFFSKIGFHEEVITSEAVSEKEALSNLETTLKETIIKNQEIIKQKYPDFFEGEGQLSLF